MFCFHCSISGPSLSWIYSFPLANQASNNEPILWNHIPVDEWTSSSASAVFLSSSTKLPGISCTQFSLLVFLLFCLLNLRRGALCQIPSSSLVVVVLMLKRQAAVFQLVPITHSCLRSLCCATFSFIATTAAPSHRCLFENSNELRIFFFIFLLLFYLVLRLISRIVL